MIPLRVVTTFDPHPDLVRRELHRVRRAAHRAVGVKWAVEMLPLHFGAGARDRYGYTARTAAWNRRKARLKALGQAQGGAGDDLIFRGTLRSQVLMTARFNIRDFPTRVTIRMTGPEYFTLRPRAKHTRRLANEVLLVTARERRELGDTFDQAFNRELRKLRAERRLRKSHRTG
jgi:hypothetical protein